MRGDKRVSLDLGLTESPAPELDADLLKGIAADEGNVYFCRDGEWFKAALRARHFYKLLPTREGHAPTHCIDGIRMHLMKDTTPDENAEAITSSAGVKKGDRVLDVCTGLGYTAIAARRRGASVISIEVDENVLELARINPWSRDLFSPGINLIVGDAAEEVKKLPDSSFDVVIHDPPRLALAGELYGAVFYKELFRVACKGARLVHYIGGPGSRHRGKDVAGGAVSRLKSIGWQRVVGVKRIQSVLAEK